MNSASNIFLIGPMGAGKTTLGRLLASKLGRQFIDSDAYISEAAGMDIKTIFSREGEDGFRQRETRALRELANLHSAVVATGGGAILAQENRKLLKKNGTVVFLHPDTDVQLHNLTQSSDTRPLLSGADDLRKTLQKLNAARLPLYQQTADLTVSVNNDTSEQIVEKIIHLISSKITHYE